GDASALRITQPQNLVPRRDVDGAVRMTGDVHRGRSAFEEGRELVGLAIAVGVFDDADAIELRPLVVRGPKVRVALNNKQPALRIEMSGDRLDDVRSRGEFLDDEPRIRSNGRVLGGNESCGQKDDWPSESRHELLLGRLERIIAEPLAKGKDES